MLKSTSRKFLSFLFPRRKAIITNNGLHCFSLKASLCALIESSLNAESPQLPAWVKFSETNTLSSEEEDEDFVIPSLADWVDSHKLDTHNELVRKALSPSIDNDVEAASNVLKKRYPSPEAVAQAFCGYKFKVTSSFVEQLFKRFSNDWVSAFGIFIWAKTQFGYRHSPELYNFMVDILGKLKKFDLMWELVGEMNQLEGYVTLVTMMKVMRRLARAGKYKEAIEAFHIIERFGVNQDVTSLNVLMDALVKENSVEDAHDVFFKFKDSIRLNSHSFNILIHGWCKARKFDQAHRTMEEMREHGFSPDVISYTSFIEAHCREKDFRKVKEDFEKMKEEGIAPSAVTYTIVMHALGKAREISLALDIYEKMKISGCVPDSSFYSSLIFILSKAGRLKDASEVFEDMPKQGVSPDVLTYNTMISFACAHSQEERALQLLKEMEEKQCKPNLETYAPLLKMCCRKKRMKVLNFLLYHMFKNDVSIEASTYSLLVHGSCKSGKLEHACSFFEQMVSKGLIPMDCTYKMLMEELERKSMLKAKELIENLMSQLRVQRTDSGS